MNNVKQKYEDFYVVYLDMFGNIIYPTNLEEAKIVRSLLKKTTPSGYIYTDNNRYCYKKRVRRIETNDTTIQVLELSNIAEYLNQINESSIDEITHLCNRKEARSQFNKYIDIAYQEKEDFAIILADIDCFKDINDTYGHNNGDIVLSEVSRIMYCSTRQEKYRPQDIVARIGGDEFIIVMKNLSEKIAIERAEKVRNDVQNYKVHLFSETNDADYFTSGTLSMGIYHVTYEELVELYDKGYTTSEIRDLLMNRCDTALYLSKNNGKNKITSYDKQKHLEL